MDKSNMSGRADIGVAPPPTSRDSLKRRSLNGTSDGDLQKDRKSHKDRGRHNRPHTLELIEVDSGSGHNSPHTPRTAEEKTSRHASTTPSTPESERRRLNGVSPAGTGVSPLNSSQESASLSLSDGAQTLGHKSSRHSSRGSFHESTSGAISPISKPQDIKGNPSPELVMNKSKNDKFHRIFKDFPEDEHCLKSYSCAFQGDILIQGYLYISPNWFCFFSRILGIEKQIKIPVQSVLNLTRERTAIFIPNAVGIVTAEDKYVFGSLLSRDNTYRVMHTVWKSLAEPVAGEPGAGSLGRNSDEGSESSLCIACGQHTGETPHDCPAELEEDDDDSVDGGQTPTTASVTYSLSSQETAQQPSKDEETAEVQSKNAVIASTSTHSRSMSVLRNMPKTQLMLLICSIMVVFLATTSVIMLHKILVLQARIETQAMFSGHTMSSESMASESIYFLQHERHHATIEQLHSVLQANIVVLDQVHTSMKNLAASMTAHAQHLHNGSHTHDET